MARPIASRLLNNFLRHFPVLYRNRLLPQLYWDLMANDIGVGVAAFPPYVQLGAKEVVGQDISASPIGIAARRARVGKIVFVPEIRP